MVDTRQALHVQPVATICLTTVSVTNPDGSFRPCEAQIRHLGEGRGADDR
jgi:hypothetical protein